jgi:hypothetical protein
LDSKPTIFLSHASDDKVRLRPLVWMLHYKYRFPLWLDKPEGITEDEEILKCGRIPWGEAWVDAISNGLNAGSTVVLFAWSEAARERFRRRGVAKPGSLKWEVEQAYGRGQAEGSRRLYGVRLDDTPTTDLPAPFSDLQFADVSLLTGVDAPAELHTTMSQIQADHDARLSKRAARLEQAALGSRVVMPNSAKLDDSLIYAADRLDAHDAVGGAIERARLASTSVCTFIAGPEDEEPERFAERCWSDFPVLPIRVDWNPDWDPKSEFIARYHERVCVAIWDQRRRSEENVTDWLRQQHMTIAPWSPVSSIRWRSGEGALQIRQWADYWRKLAAGAPASPGVVPVLLTTMPKAGPSWSGAVPPGPIQNRHIAESFARETQTTPPPVLSPMVREELMAWLEGPVRSSLDVDTVPEFRQHPVFGNLKSLLHRLTPDVELRKGLFRRTRAEQRRVTMQQFVAAIRSL